MNKYAVSGKSSVWPPQNIAVCFPFDSWNACSFFPYQLFQFEIFLHIRAVIDPNAFEYSSEIVSLGVVMQAFAF